ncbi:CocE/NonD family hydrolase [Nonomuraea sp. B12E4]|uniref:CocE/NonD family hydrolase n=1 Tax=Nonomuraea sp. B12E4 TaxID=3153564 RepID=UPI00325E058E
MTDRCWIKALATGVAAVLLGPLPAAQASAAPALTVRNGHTQPVFSYAGAVRERVFVEAPMDSDHDGRRDRVAVDIVRPAEPGLKVASVLKATPYIGKNGVFSDWYDEYFVPRGYAVVEAAVQGTGESEGCPATGGRPDVLATTAVVNWLTRRARATYPDGRAAVADWSAGAVGMVGLSYDGTLAEAAAAEGVPGLKTIVPEGAISSWYDYARDQGVAYTGALGDRYPEYQADRVISDAARARCGEALKALGDDAADDAADYTAFWAERDYRRHASRVRASVLLAQGLNDQKVRGRQFATWWQALAEHDVPRKLWLHDGGHEDPVLTGGDAWRETLHRWMDHWLYGLDNGIMNEPRVTVQRPDGSWQTFADWPQPGTRDVRMWFGPATPTAAGTLRPSPSAHGGTHSFTDDPAQAETTMVADPQTSAAHRLAYLGPPLTEATRLSGTTRVRVRMTSTTTSTPLTALLVDYGPASSQPSAAPHAETADLAPAALTGKLPSKLPVVTRGAIDVKNRHSLTRPSPVTPGRSYTVDWRLHPTDHVFPAGHRIGLVIVANDRDYITTDPAAGSVTVDLTHSSLTLPLVKP